MLLSAGIAQLVEHNLAKVGVASSNLVSRSIFNRVIAPENQAGVFYRQGTGLHIVMAEWQSGYAAACKAVDLGSIPGSASISQPVIMQLQ